MKTFYALENSFFPPYLLFSICLYATFFFNHPNVYMYYKQIIYVSYTDYIYIQGRIKYFVQGGDKCRRKVGDGRGGGRFLDNLDFFSNIKLKVGYFQGIQKGFVFLAGNKISSATIVLTNLLTQPFFGYLHSPLTDFLLLLSIFRGLYNP